MDGADVRITTDRFVNIDCKLIRPVCSERFVIGATVTVAVQLTEDGAREITKVFEVIQPRKYMPWATKERVLPSGNQYTMD
jgi:hypothetical protein